MQKKGKYRTKERNAVKNAARKESRLGYQSSRRDVQTMSEYNDGRLSREEACALLGSKYGEPAA